MTPLASICFFVLFPCLPSFFCLGSPLEWKESGTRSHWELVRRSCCIRRYLAKKKRSNPIPFHPHGKAGFPPKGWTWDQCFSIKNPKHFFRTLSTFLFRTHVFRSAFAFAFVFAFYILLAVSMLSLRMLV